MRAYEIDWVQEVLKLLPELVIRGRKIRLPILQGGMGVGISMKKLVRAVMENGGIGIYSSAFMDELYHLEFGGERISQKEAVRRYIKMVRDQAGEGEYFGINAMVKLEMLVETIEGAMTDADFIFLSAGISRDAPKYVEGTEVGIIPIVASADAFRMIVRAWGKFGRKPDAVVIEGDLCGGHIGFKPEQIGKPDYALEKILREVVAVIRELGIEEECPVIVAGGLHCFEDMLYFAELGARGFQFGTLFLGTHESEATDYVKRRLVQCTADDLVLAHEVFGAKSSPAGYPFSTISTQAIQLGSSIEPDCIGCPIGVKCPTIKDSKRFFCIGAGLKAAQKLGQKAGDEEERLKNVIITVGRKVAPLVKEIISAREVILRLLTPADPLLRKQIGYEAC